MGFTRKILFLLSNENKKKLGILSFLMFFGMIFEMIGLGILIPALNLVSSPNSSLSNYLLKSSLIVKFGIIYHYQLVFCVMLVLILIYLIKTFYLIFLSYRQSQFSSLLSDELSVKLFKGYINLPYKFHLNRNSTELVRNVQSEINNFNNASQSAIALILEFAVIIGIVLFLIFVEPIGAISIVFLLFICTYFFLIITRKRIYNWGKQRLDFSVYSTLHLNQGLAGVKEVKLFGKEEQFVDLFAKYNNRIAKIQVKISTMNFIPRLYLEFISVLSLASLIIIFNFQGKSLDSVVPILGVFVAAAFRLIPSVNRIIGSLQVLKVSQPIIDLLYDEFSMINSNELVSNKHQNFKLRFNNEISLESITFSYDSDNRKTLNNVSLVIEKGEFVGIVGSSGSGKSTLIDLILGLLKPNSGIIKIDDNVLSFSNLSDWQKNIGYVPQVIYLTDSSLKSNIAFGIPDDQIDEESIYRAIESAQLSDLVKNLPDGINSFVGERGVRLSGGQRQRIGIARALYNDPEVLVLDEATSALDNETEKEVMSSVIQLQGKKTIIVVAHRLSTIKYCDKVYKLDNGKIHCHSDSSRGF